MCDCGLDHQRPASRLRVLTFLAALAAKRDPKAARLYLDEIAYAVAIGGAAHAEIISR